MALRDSAGYPVSGATVHGLEAAREACNEALGKPATDWERRHLVAAAQLANGHWHAAGRTLEDLSIDYPRDLLALQVGHQIDFFTGEARTLRDRVARVLPAWVPESFLVVHNWWHLALYHLDLGEIAEVLTLYDGPMNGGQSGVVMDMLDASALLWRLQLRGVDVGDRWTNIADRWAPLATAGNYAFNDLHAVMAFIGAGRPNAIAQVFETQAEVMRGDSDNARFTREVGSPACRALVAFSDGNYAETIRLLRAIRPIAQRFGGSHAQRDVLDLTLIEAAYRGGETALHAALAAERLAAKPASPLAQMFAARARDRVLDG